MAGVRPGLRRGVGFGPWASGNLCCAIVNALWGTREMGWEVFPMGNSSRSLARKVWIISVSWDALLSHSFSDCPLGRSSMVAPVTSSIGSSCPPTRLVVRMVQNLQDSSPKATIFCVTVWRRLGHRLHVCGHCPSCMVTHTGPNQIHAL